MSKDKDEAKDRESGTPASKAAAAEAKQRENKGKELDEGLDESFPSSDAPASTRRSSDK